MFKGNARKKLSGKNFHSDSNRNCKWTTVKYALDFYSQHNFGWGYPSPGQNIEPVSPKRSSKIGVVNIDPGVKMVEYNIYTGCYSAHPIHNLYMKKHSWTMVVEDLIGQSMWPNRSGCFSLIWIKKISQGDTWWCVNGYNGPLLNTANSWICYWLVNKLVVAKKW
jgi:hypothetical protein